MSAGLVRLEIEVLNGHLADARHGLSVHPEELFTAAELVVTAADAARIEGLPLDEKTYLHAVDRLTDEVYWLAKDVEDGSVFGRGDHGATRHYCTAMSA
jgi:hypothetical protein